MHGIRSVIIFILYLLASLDLHAQVGKWNVLTAYGEVNEIVPTPDKIYVLATPNLFSINPVDQSVQTYSKADILTDNVISHIAWNDKSRKLLILYKNANIDLLTEEGKAINLPDYHLKSMTEDKSVFSIYMHDQKAYLCTTYGILVIDMQRALVDRTYHLGQNIRNVMIKDGYLFAATKEGKILRKPQDEKQQEWTEIKDDNIAYKLTLQNIRTDVYDKYRQCRWQKNDEDNTITQYKKSSDGQTQILNRGYRPNAPQSIYANRLLCHQNILYTCGGAHIGYALAYRPGSIQYLDEGMKWTSCQAGVKAQTGIDFLDIVTIDAHPAKPLTIYAGSANSGLYLFEKGKLQKHFTPENSPLKAYQQLSSGQPDKAKVAVNSIKYHPNGDLWVLQSWVKDPIHILRADGSWQNPRTEALNSITEKLGNLKHLTFISDRKVVFANDHYLYPAIFVYDITDQTIDTYKDFVNQDGKKYEISLINCIKQDANHDLWIGTDVGLFVLQNKHLQDKNVIFTQIKVPRNDGTSYADYLLSGTNVSDIDIDAAGRKWIATSGQGVYLIDADNITERHHFTADETPLPSDEVESIVVDHAQARVYMGTSAGLCSYQTSVYMPSEENRSDKAYAFPNPVKPDYQGIVTVVGLTDGADIKITDVSGRLITQGKSTGGSFTWDLKNAQGKRVSSGVYHVLSATRDGHRGIITRIAVVR